MSSVSSKKLTRYANTSTAKATFDVSYGFIAETVLNVSLPIPYAFTGVSVSSNDKVFGWRSDWTQIIANSFQDWNKIRKDNESTGQYFLNAMAMFVEDTNKYWNGVRKEGFLE